jgi:hypothetical protein
VDAKSLPPRPLKFSTDGIPQSEALEAWQKLYDRYVMPTEAVAAMDQPFRGSAEVASTPSRLTHSLERSGYRNETCLLLASTLGEVVVATDDAEIRLGPGDATIVADRVGSPSLVSELSGLLMLFIRVAVLSSCGTDVRDAFGAVVPNANEALQLLVRYVSAFGEGVITSASHLHPQISEQLYDLAALAVRRGGRQASWSWSNNLQLARLTAIKADIDPNIGEPKLSPAFFSQKNTGYPNAMCAGCLRARARHSPDMFCAGGWWSRTRGWQM